MIQILFGFVICSIGIQMLAGWAVLVSLVVLYFVSLSGIDFGGIDLQMMFFTYMILLQPLQLKWMKK